MQYQLGSLEETALLLVASADPDEAYAYAMTLQYEKHLGTSISISALHTVMKRLEKKGFLKSEMSGPSEKRGGRRKRVFRLTNSGLEAIRAARETRMSLWALIPQLRFSI
ncbi:MAG: PadR family transcriptional regulator [Lewinella sp.]|nr:PadR family transcriptional regulator [Lewinella sp.]